ncbi:MAG: DNA glycosylase [Methanomicrobium sp.]|nr:DNA glycosylase [Methanomicrobium sp.]
MAEFDIIKLDDNQPFDLDKTLSCGQAPRWIRENGWWYGIIKDSVIKIRQDENKLIFTGVNSDFIKDYFCLSLNLNEVYDVLSEDMYAKKAMDLNYGLRIVSQDPWECMIFQMTVNKIRTKSQSDRITRVSSKIGRKIIFDNIEFYTFPRPEEIIKAGLPALKSCNISYFADNIMLAAKRVTENPGWEEKISSADYDDAVLMLKEFKGIKHRVAEWILLFAFKRYDAFPVDAHIRELFAENYLKGHYFGKSGDEKSDDAIRESGKKIFGKFSGYALEYLFCSREFIDE